VGKTLLTYAEAFAAGPSIAGGKGWNLGRLDHYAFLVPAGAVLSAEVYQTILARPAIAKLAAALAEAPTELILSDAVRTQLGTIRQSLEAESLTDDSVAALESFLTQEHLIDDPLAVRSSATAEDGALASFAGIHESILNLTGLDAIVAAISRCYASLWTPQALAYRRRQRISDSDCGCAVVICRMVTATNGGPPRAAGVAFSCDPRTGRRDLVVINATPGLGAALVQGTVNPQPFVTRPTGMRWSIVERPDTRAFPRPALTDAHVQELAILTMRVHWALGDGQNPQDVEWALDGERFWLVQARPVTHLPHRTFPRIARKPVHWSNANAKDVVPGVLSCLGWGLLQSIVWQILYSLLDAIGYAVPPGTEMLRRFSGRGYLDLSALQWAFYDALGATPAETNRDLGGSQPQIDVPSTHPLRGMEGIRRVRARLRLVAQVWKAERRISPEIARVLDEVRAARGLDRTGCALSELHSEFRRWEDMIGRVGPLFQLGNGYCAAGLTLLKSLANRLDRHGAASLVNRLLAGAGGITSAEHGYRVWDLAAVARGDAAAITWLRAASPPGGDAATSRSLPPDSPFRQSLERFLHDFGHRAVVEAEIANPRWIDDITFVRDLVRAELDGDTAHDPRAAAARVRTSAEAELRRTTWFLRPLATRLAGIARRGLALREGTKSAAIGTFEPMRRIFLELGRRLVALGHVDEAADVFHLSTRDLEAFMLGHWDGRGARALAADRKDQRRAWLAESPPDVITCSGGRVTAPGLVPARPESPFMPPSDGEATRWHGLPASAGRCSGVARVLHSPSEGGRLRRGEILVAPSTDPGWTPLFLRAGAIVMETGGYISHGAIVAREYGLPAVINLPGILQHISDGDQLVVDGDSGDVIRVTAHGASI
jgi:pyruvate,water dikinase